ncbi:2-hydroxyacid dehydrogenase [Novosphingobium sp. 9]|uniref:2-hydroxyacid dehydrogenase n=1 Tax=Novosphingobium sp. 9 TaxID=2025349 RepID=UPI0021B50736|nr:2-hydroxyacid dehydrogenase [Novosphingobium sp. 9]
MPHIELLLTNPLPASEHSRDLEGFVVHKLWEAADPDALLAEVGARIRGVIANGPTRMDEALLSQLPELEIVANFGVGYDRIDVPAATRHGVVVTNTPSVLDDEVADLTLGLLLATVRKIPQADRYVRDGRWLQSAFPLSTSLRGRKVGILGLGNIGLAIARRLAGFEVEIAYHSRRRREGVAYEYCDSPSALAQAVDVLIVIVPATPETHHIVDADLLEKLGPNGILINVARGSVVDEAALIAALENGTILAAGLDVFEHEPVVPAALIAAENTVLLPHIGSASTHTRSAMSDLVIANICGWFRDGHAVTPVNEIA